MKVKATKQQKPDAGTEKAKKIKKKSVSFQADAGAKVEEPVVKKAGPVVTHETEVDGVRVSKRKRGRKSKNFSQSKKQKLMGEIATPTLTTVEFEPDQKKFTDFDLDERILKVIGEIGWEHPTQVQESVVHLALENKNIMARARTGSGKTAAFLLPILHKVIQHIAVNDNAVGPFALFIAPTKELATQIHKLLSRLLAPLPFLSALNLTELSPDETSVWEKDTPSLVVSTPGKIVQMLKIRSTFCNQVRHLVLDEADLLLSFGYEDEMSALKESLPSEYQCIMTSATLTDDMTFLKKIFMTGPVVTIKLKEGDLPGVDQLAQYQISCQDDEQRFAIMVSMVKLKLVVGKTIIFVNSTDRCYKLSLVLRTFGVKSCILNSEMPANSRCHVINQFNEGVFNYIIASDAADTAETFEAEPVPDAPKTDAQKQQPKKKAGRRDKESGVSRGIDFHQVANVVNFDFPINSDVYIHRVGRTARGWNKGTALSFCIPSERALMEKIQEEINAQVGQNVLMPYEIRIKELDSFLLRTREALLKCTKGAIKHARIREIKLELMRSEKLQGFFAKNPREKGLMTTSEHPIQLRLHNVGIADVPDYIVPKALRGMDFSTQTKKKKRTGLKHRQKSANNKKFQRNQNNPLKSFKSKK